MGNDKVTRVVWVAYIDTPMPLVASIYQGTCECAANGNMWTAEDTSGVHLSSTRLERSCGCTIVPSAAQLQPCTDGIDFTDGWVS